VNGKELLYVCEAVRIKLTAAFSKDLQGIWYDSLFLVFGSLASTIKSLNLKLQFLKILQLLQVNLTSDVKEQYYGK